MSAQTGTDGDQAPLAKHVRVAGAPAGEIPKLAAQVYWAAAP
jgi:hypothetical protein